MKDVSKKTKTKFLYNYYNVAVAANELSHLKTNF